MLFIKPSATSPIMLTTTFHNQTLSNGVIVHYAESGHADAPILLLLHGFPSTNLQFRNLIPLLAASYHIIAPDLPGFGHTVLPEGTVPSFDLMAETISQLVDALDICKFAVYVFDYGAPTLFRLALKRPELISAIVTQNGNAYEEGLGADFWGGLQKWWAEGEEYGPMREVLFDAVGDIEWTKAQYYDGVPEENRKLVDPQMYTLDYLQHLANPAARDTQMRIFWDYQNNVKLYPQFQEYLRKHQPPVLAVWGENDPCFVYPGALAYKRDVPKADIQLLNGGHFLLETHVREVASLMREFLGRIKW